MNNAEIVKLSLAKVLAAIEAIEDELGRLDAVAGDGDHGMGMVRGLRAAVAAESGSSPKEILGAAGAAFADAAGGSSGALVGVLINTIAQSLPDENIGTAESDQFAPNSNGRSPKIPNAASVERTNIRPINDTEPSETPIGTLRPIRTSSATMAMTPTQIGSMTQFSSIIVPSCD